MTIASAVPAKAMSIPYFSFFFRSVGEWAEKAAFMLSQI
jgi:hypothetical protein